MLKSEIAGASTEANDGLAGTLGEIGLREADIKLHQLYKEETGK